MEMDINALSRPYDPDVDDEMQEMPVQGFSQGGDVGGIGYETVDPTPGAGTLLPPPTANLEPINYLDPTTEAGRVQALKNVFNANTRGFQTQVSNAPAEQTYSRNPYVATMPIDPDTGAPRDPRSYFQKNTDSFLGPNTGNRTIAEAEKMQRDAQARMDEASSKKLLEDYTRAVNAVPYRAPSKPQMPTTQDFINRTNKGLPGLGRKTTIQDYGTAFNPNYDVFPYDPLKNPKTIRTFADGGTATKTMLNEGEEYVAPLAKAERDALIKSTPGGMNVVSHLIVQNALKRLGVDPTGMSYKQMGAELSKLRPGENYYVVTDTAYSPYVKPGAGTTAPPPATTQPPATGGTAPPPATTPPPPPIVSQTDVTNVTGTKPTGTTGTGVSVAPGTNIPFQPLPGTLQTQPAKADLTKFNAAYNNNQNFSPIMGQLPPGFSFDPSKYFQPSQAQNQIKASPNLTPQSLGQYQQTTDRLGNLIAIPTIDPLTFQPFVRTRAEGGLVDDEDDREARGAKEMLKGYEQLTGPRETQVVRSPNRQAVRSRQASQIVDKQGRPVGMSMTYESMSAAQGSASPEQMATAKAMLADLMRQNLTKRRFAEGGDVLDVSMEDPENFADGGSVSNFTGGASDKKGAPDDKLTFGDKYLVEPALDLYSKIMDRESLPANKRIFLDSVRGGDRSQITEKNFSPSELAQMDEMVRGRYKGLSEPLTKYGQHLETALKGKLSKEEKAQYMTDLDMIKKFQAGQFTPALMALAEGEEPSNARRRGLVMSGAAGELAKLGKILPEVKYSDYPTGVVQKSRSLSAGKTPTESNATSLGQFRYGLGPEGNFVIKDMYDFNPRVGSEELDAVPALVTEGPYGRLREYAGRKMPPGQGRDVLVNLPKRAEGSPEEGEGYMPPTNPFAGKAAKQAEMRAARGERSRVAAAREKVARTPALDEAGGETTDEFIQRTMGFDPSVNEKRGTFLPMPIKRNGKTEFIAPNTVKDLLLPYNLSSQALTTGRFDESKVPEAAMNTSLASLATGKAPAGSLGMAVKIPGGQWRHAISVTDPVTGEIIRGKPSNMSEYIARAMERVPEGREDVKEFIINKLYPYLKKSLGTDSDPIRAAVLEGKVKDDSPLYYGMPPAFREYMLEPAREAQGLQAKIAATEPRIAELRQASQEARDRGLTAEADSAAAQLKTLQRTLPYTDAEKRAFATKSEALQDFHRNYDTKTGIATKIISDPGEGERADYGLSGAAIETIRNRLTEAGVRPEHQNPPTYVENLTLNDFAKKLFPDNEDHQQALIQGVRSGDPRYKQISDAIAFNEPLYDLANSSGVDIPGFKQQEIGQLLSEIPADRLKKMSAAEAFVTAFPTYQLTKDFSGLVEKIRAGAAYPKEALDLYLNRGLQPVKVPDTPGWYRVTTPQAVRLEGAQMRHSVGGYATQDNYNKGGRPAFNAGTTRVYSLRPQKNKPEVTLDVYDDPDTGLVKVNTIYGKENSDPSPYKAELFKLFDSIPNLDAMSLPRLYYGSRENSPAGTVDWAREYLEARPNVQVPSPASRQRAAPGGNAWENVGQDDNLMRQVINMVNNAPGNEAQMAARQRIRDRIAARNARRAAEGIPPVEEE